MLISTKIRRWYEDFRDQQRSLNKVCSLSNKAVEYSVERVRYGSTRVGAVITFCQHTPSLKKDGIARMRWDLPSPPQTTAKESSFKETSGAKLLGRLLKMRCWKLENLTCPIIKHHKPEEKYPPKSRNTCLRFFDSVRSRFRCTNDLAVAMLCHW